MKRKLAFQRRHYVALAGAIARVRAFGPHHDTPAEALRDAQEEVADVLAATIRNSTGSVFSGL